MPITQVNYNSETNPNDTLLTLRTRLLRRLGFSAQVNNPPPGMAELLNDFLLSAQRYLYNKFPGLRTERFFTWTLVAGTRFYDLTLNNEGLGGTPESTTRLNALKISDVYVEDLNGAWHPLICGIPPGAYTSGDDQGLPSHYQIAQGIELYLTPDAAYKLRIKGHFLPEAFTADGDEATIDGELVFLWALANAKAHYGRADAQEAAGQANAYLLTQVGGSHMTRRYIPGGVVEAPLPKPVLLPVA